MTALWSFAAELRQRLLDALEIARHTYADEDVDRIMAEIAALQNEESAEPKPDAP